MTRLHSLILTLALTASAQVISDEERDASDSAIQPPPPREFVTEHKGRFNGESLSYTARAGETYLRNIDGEVTASIFSFDYLVLDDGEQRPVTFVWNGGPGSASLWLHMGAFGPRRVVVPSDATHAGAPPYPMADSAETILDLTDLVFVDPVGTGYSRAMGEHEGKEFWGLMEDAQSMALFIRTWLTENGRWNSPRYILGESYGTTRAAAVASVLEDKYKVALNGLVFISQALDYAGSTPYVDDNLISFITYLPTMAATAYYHEKVDAQGATLEAWVQAARDFATDELLPALFRGNTLDAHTSERVRDKLAAFTGLSPEYIERARLRIQGKRFAMELLRSEGMSLGGADGRYTARPVDTLAADTKFDATSSAISSAYKSALLTHLRDKLGVQWDREYLYPADPKLKEEWNFNPGGRDAEWEPHWVNTARDLAHAMEINPSLRVLVASGYYDLVTPFFDAEFTLNRHGIEPGRVEYRYYEGGHMMYLNEPERVQILEDVRDFLETTLAR